ncbi:hypothetical protein HXX76_005340 [Chlamydomonas incerta]|uniref:Uncharacterized protein n=1 Tax=Chlamydomonas incerta TaxID=51695 RepID=A0A835TEA7_CHLIN|nr:hypothetical protein HXX76_005340 [Chlamydomonas incerta]|eukprot:KAG2438799.1 hypothetical protein HXX76_005340 [Chlamydomonas incerta]
MDALTSGEQAALPMVKSLLSRLRLPGGRASKHDVKPNVTDSASGKQSDQALGGRAGWAASPFELGQGLPPAEHIIPGTAPGPVPAPRAPSLSALSTPPPQNAGDQRTAQGATPGGVASAATAVLRHDNAACHDQAAQRYTAQAVQQQQQQQQRRPLQLQHAAASAGAPSVVPLAAQPSMDAPLPQQHSWGSPRSDMQRSVSSSDTVAALLQEAQGQQSGGGAAGAAYGRSPGGRPSGVPPLNLARMGIAPVAAIAPPAAPHHARADGAPAGAGAGAGAESHSTLLAGVAELEQELAGWAAAPQWQPSSQGRWYVYPPIGRKDVAPVEALVSTLTPAQAAEVAVLWRQYAAARYSAELMAGRAVRLCRELTRELANSRAHTGHVAEQGAEHAEKLATTIKSLQQQLDEARYAAAATQASAVHGNRSTCSSCHQPLAQQLQSQPLAPRSAPSAPAVPAVAAAEPAVNEYLASPTRHHAPSVIAAAARAVGASLTPESCAPNAPAPVPVPAPARPQLEASACKAAARRPSNNRAARASLASAAAVGLLETDEDGYSYSSCSSSPRPEELAAAAAGARPHVQQQQAAGPGGTEALRTLADENEELLSQLEHMRSLFLEAHADGRALREALEEVDAECAALRQHGSGLSRQAAAVLQENTGLRREVEALRGALQQQQQQQQRQHHHLGAATGTAGPQQPLPQGPNAPAHIPRPPPGAAGTASFRTPLAAAAAAAGGSQDTPLTAPRPPVLVAGVGVAPGVSSGTTWTPPPASALGVPAAGAGAGVAPYSAYHGVARTASTGPRPLAPQPQEHPQRSAPYVDARLGAGGSSGGAAGAGQVVRALAQALETEGVIAVVQAVPASGTGAGNLQGRALSRNGSASGLPTPAAPSLQQHQHQLYDRVRGQQQQQQQVAAAQGQQLLDEMAWRQRRGLLGGTVGRGGSSRGPRGAVALACAVLVLAWCGGGAVAQPHSSRRDRAGRSGGWSDAALRGLGAVGAPAAFGDGSRMAASAGGSAAAHGRALLAAAADARAGRASGGGLGSGPLGSRIQGALTQQVKETTSNVENKVASIVADKVAQQVISDMNNVTHGALSAVGLGSKEQLGQYLGSWLGWGLSAVTALASQPHAAAAAAAATGTADGSDGGSTVGDAAPEASEDAAASPDGASQVASSGSTAAAPAAAAAQMQQLEAQDEAAGGQDLSVEQLQQLLAVLQAAAADAGSGGGGAAGGSPATEGSAAAAMDQQQLAQVFGPAVIIRDGGDSSSPATSRPGPGATGVDNPGSDSSSGGAGPAAKAAAVAAALEQLIRSKQAAAATSTATAAPAPAAAQDTAPSPSAGAAASSPSTAAAGSASGGTGGSRGGQAGGTGPVLPKAPLPGKAAGPNLSVGRDVNVNINVNVVPVTQPVQGGGGGGGSGCNCNCGGSPAGGAGGLPDIITQLLGGLVSAVGSSAAGSGGGAGSPSASAGTMLQSAPAAAEPAADGGGGEGTMQGGRLLWRLRQPRPGEAAPTAVADAAKGGARPVREAIAAGIEQRAASSSAAGTAGPRVVGPFRAVVRAAAAATAAGAAPSGASPAAPLVGGGGGGGRRRQRQLQQQEVGAASPQPQEAGGASQQVVPGAGSAGAEPQAASAGGAVVPSSLPLTEVLQLVLAQLQNPSDFALKLGVNTGGGDQGQSAGGAGGLLPPPPPPPGFVTAFGGPSDSSYGGEGAPASNSNSNPISIPALLGQPSAPAMTGPAQQQSSGTGFGGSGPRLMVCPPCHCGD